MDFKQRIIQELNLTKIQANTLLKDYVVTCEKLAKEYHTEQLKLRNSSQLLNATFKINDRVDFKEYKNATVAEVFKNGCIDIETDEDYIYIKIEDMKYVTKSI